MMAEGFGNWIRDRRRLLGMGRREDLVAKTGLGLSTILRAEAGKNVNRANMLSIAKALRVDPPELLADWSQGTIDQREFLERFTGRTEFGRPVEPFLAERGLRPGTKRMVPSLPSLEFVIASEGEGTPILGEVTAGGLVESMVFQGDEEPERVPLRYPDRQRVYALRIRGESMSPEYRPGEVLMVQDGVVDDLEDGEDAIIQCNGGRDGASTFKRCFFLGEGRIKLVPLNSAYATQECDREHVVRIGKVIGVYREVRKARRNG